jgi:hypothetical protein
LTLPFDHCFIDIVGRDRTRAWFKLDTISKAGFFLWNCHDEACTAKQQATITTPIRWSIHGMLLFLCTECEQVHIPDITWTLNLDEFGGWAEKTPPYYRYNRNPFANTPSSDDPEVYYDAAEQIIPALFALALMHAKNSSLLDNEAPAKLSKKYQQKHGRGLTSYKTIQVKPMRQVKTASDVEGNTKISSRLHIVRGHWKDYRFGEGLFGKYKDIFWWDSQMRGDADEGEIRSSYNIQAPDKP